MESPIKLAGGVNTSSTQGLDEATQQATEKNLLEHAAETPTALAAVAEATAQEPSVTKPTLVTGHWKGKTVTRTLIKVKVAGVVVLEDAQSVASSGEGINPICFKVPAGAKWEWEKTEGTVEANGFKVSYVIGG